MSVTLPSVVLPWAAVPLALPFGLAAAGIRTRAATILGRTRIHYPTPSHPPTLSNFALFIILIDHQYCKEGSSKIRVVWDSNPRPHSKKMDALPLDHGASLSIGVQFWHLNIHVNHHSTIAEKGLILWLNEIFNVILGWRLHECRDERSQIRRSSRSKTPIRGLFCSLKTHTLRPDSNSYRHQARIEELEW